MKQVKSDQIIIKEKASLAEGYLQRIGKELYRLRNSWNESEVTVFSNSSSIIGSSPIEKKKKMVKRKLKRAKRIKESDIKRLTLNLILLEAELDTKEREEKIEIKKNSRKWSSLDKRSRYPEAKEISISDDSEIQINVSSPEKLINRESRYAAEKEEYFNQFKNYKIRHESDNLGMFKILINNNYIDSTQLLYLYFSI